MARMDGVSTRSSTCLSVPATPADSTMPSDGDCATRAQRHVPAFHLDETATSALSVLAISTSVPVLERCSPLASTVSEMLALR